MAKQYWLVKQEPSSYAWETFVKDKETAWTGVRNSQARIHLKTMKKGDLAFYYHSNEGKEIVGLAQVSREAYPDPTADEEGWVCVDLQAVKPLFKTLTLLEIKSDPELKEMVLAKNSRLSVSPVKKNEFEKILKLTGTKV